MNLTTCHKCELIGLSHFFYKLLTKIEDIEFITINKLDFIPINIECETNFYLKTCVLKILKISLWLIAVQSSLAHYIIQNKLSTSTKL